MHGVVECAEAEGSVQDVAVDEVEGEFVEDGREGGEAEEALERWGWWGGGGIGEMEEGAETHAREEDEGLIEDDARKHLEVGWGGWGWRRLFTNGVPGLDVEEVKEEGGCVVDGHKYEPGE